MQRKFTLIFLSFYTMTVWGLSVDSLKIQPPNPSEGDSIILTAFHPLSTAAVFYSREVLFHDSLIEVHYCYTTSMVFSAADTNDITPIGKLPMGNYTLKYTFKQPYYWEVDSITGCDSYQYYDSALLSFSVTSVTGSKNQVVENITISPNPVSSYLTISISEEHTGSMLTLNDLTGRVALQSEITNPQSEISIATLPSGIYLTVLTTPSGQRAVRKVVKE